ncbi:MAG: PASTA domain-containing protein [Pyrinomonadaceae bacterium]
MSILKTGFSAIGRLAAIGLLAAAFLLGLAGVVYMSLQGAEIQVPEITGKDFSQSEKELALLGLKIKKRADRVSPETPDTVIEQLPKPGETVKTGQMILVVTSKGDGGNGDKGLKKIGDEDDSDKIEEMIDDKPKKAKSNSNRKKADTTRDSANTNSNSDTNSNSSNSNKKETSSNDNSSEKTNKNGQTQANTKQPNPGKKPFGDTPPKPAKKP